MTDKFIAALADLKDALTNGDALDAALEEIAAEHAVTPMALRNRATTAWGDLVALGEKLSSGAKKAARMKFLEGELIFYREWSNKSGGPSNSTHAELDRVSKWFFQYMEEYNDLKNQF